MSQYTLHFPHHRLGLLPPSRESPRHGVALRRGTAARHTSLPHAWNAALSGGPKVRKLMQRSALLILPLSTDRRLIEKNPVVPTPIIVSRSRLTPLSPKIWRHPTFPSAAKRCPKSRWPKKKHTGSPAATKPQTAADHVSMKAD